MPTLRDLRRLVADHVAPYELGTAGAESPAGTYTGTALDGSKRRLVSSDLASLDATGVMAEAPADALKNQWVYLLTTPPQQRRIPEGAYNGYARVEETLAGSAAPATSEVGTIDVERPFSSVVAAGTPFELHGIAPLRAGRSLGLHAAVNRALRVILREDTVELPAVPGTARYDVTAVLPWIRTPDQLVGCGYPSSPTSNPLGYDTYSIPGAYVRFDADRVLLFPLAYGATGQTFPLRVLRPLASWIMPQASGVWGESSVGLVDELDQCTGDADAIALVAAFYVAEAEAAACTVGSAEQQFWLAAARAYASRSVFLRDQRTRAVASGVAWPDLVSPLGPTGGRTPPYFR